ncbi:MAG: tRNA-guanine transglycosylase [Elusimicrobia bacterium]|nr:tRNA-guanine transglycosylase [Elusimicrobiota bacterium]
MTIGNAAMFRTPIFMPVATQASVKALGGDDLKSAGSKMLLANTYHLTLRPGLQVIQSAGGLHRFMNWDGGLLTDSGGFQVMSLAHLSRVHEEGVIFKSHIDGRPQKFTPENVIDAQLAFGVDAMTCLDVCLSYPSPSDQIREALEQTLRCSKRAMEQY